MNTNIRYPEYILDLFRLVQILCVSVYYRLRFLPYGKPVPADMVKRLDGGACIFKTLLQRETSMISFEVCLPSPFVRHITKNVLVIAKYEGGERAFAQRGRRAKTILSGQKVALVVPLSISERRVPGRFALYRHDGRVVVDACIDD